MAAPEEIRKVSRPLNTVVVENKTEGVRKYAVRARKGLKRIPGKHSQPVNGPVIGYIFNGEYIPIDKVPPEGVPPKEEEGAPSTPVYSYGAPIFALSVAEDIMEDLLKVFEPVDSLNIFVIAQLRAVCNVKDCNLASQYRESFLSLKYPGATLSAPSKSKLFNKLGEDVEGRQRFNCLRTSRDLQNCKVIIDGTLKQYTSLYNPLSAYNGRGRVKGRKYVSVLYAYDYDRGEPLVAQIYPGNFVDSNAITPFILDNKIDHGLVVLDKGFPVCKLREIRNTYPDLHYLTPLKRNDPRIENNKMTEFVGELPDHPGVLYKKTRIKGGSYLYSFCEIDKAASQIKKYMAKTDESADFMEQMRKKHLGMLVLESDQDMPPEKAYEGYKGRWSIEGLFDQYKNEEGLDETRVHSAFSVEASEFINSLVTIITSRMKKAYQKTTLPETYSFVDVLKELNQVWRHAGAPEPVTGDKYWEHVNLKQFDILEALGLSKPNDPDQKKDGDTTPDNGDNTDSGVQNEPTEQPADADQPKRKRGRPRKNPVEQPATAD